MTPYVELAKRFNSSVGTRHFDGVTPETDSVTELAFLQITLPGFMIPYGSSAPLIA